LDKIPQASLARLHLLLDPDFEDAIPSPDELEFRYVLDGESLDYRCCTRWPETSCPTACGLSAPAQDITATATPSPSMRPASADRIRLVAVQVLQGASGAYLSTGAGKMEGGRLQL